MNISNMRARNSNELFDGMRARAASGWTVALALSVAIFGTWIALRYANQPILEAYGFRQTQTAITSFWMIKEGWRLAYETPVAGYPWSIPFEFPLFQILAALISKWGSFPLDAAGRLLSFSFLIACAWPAFLAVRRLALPSAVAWLFCALLWSSPLYLFWGRTFMIETAALFFALMAAPYAIDLNAPRPNWRSVFLFAFWGTLGMLQKVTTAAPMIMVLGLTLLILHCRTAGFQLPSASRMIRVGVAFALPLIVTACWTRYTDLVKEQNALGAALTSSALTRWNFGTLAQRIDPTVLKIVFWDRVISPNIAGLFGIFLIGGAMFFGNRRTRGIVAVGAAMFVLPILIFTNLHRVHSYYQTASAAFLLGALAIALMLWLPLLAKRSGAVPVVLSVLALCNLMDLETARVLFFDVAVENLKDVWPGAVGILLLIGGSAIFGSSRIRKIALFGPVLFILLILVVSNIYHALNSYPVFSVIFLAGALALAFVLWLPAAAVQPAMVPITALLLVLSNLYHFSAGYAGKLSGPEKAQPVAFSLGNAIRNNTPEDDGIVVFGMNWSSEIGYYAQRKSFAVPDWFKQYDKAWNAPASFLGGKRLGAMVFCLGDKITYEKILAQPDVKLQPQLVHSGNCYLWFSHQGSSQKALQAAQDQFN